MRYQTELMRAILTNETAQEIIDWVSQLYGDSYVGLWIYQVMGVILGEVRAMAEQLRQEVRPSTAEELLALWEETYGLSSGDGLTVAQRQARLLDRKLTRSPANPAKLEHLVQSLTGCEARVTENVAPYTFTVELFCEGRAVDFDAVLRGLQRIKPSHQQMQLYMTAAAGIQIKTNRIRYQFPYRLAGTYPQINTVGGLAGGEIDILPEETPHPLGYPMTGELQAGTHPQDNIIGTAQDAGLNIGTEADAEPFAYSFAGEHNAGTLPQDNIVPAILRTAIEAAAESGAVVVPYALTGLGYAGTEPEENTVAGMLGNGLTATVETITTPIDFPLCGDDDS